MKKLYLILSIVVFVSIAVATIHEYFKEDTITVTIFDKERIRRLHSSKYLIFTDKGVYRNSDSFLKMKFRSSDMYGRLHLNEQYEITVYGWRVPLLSLYRNIVEVKEK